MEVNWNLMLVNVTEWKWEKKWTCKLGNMLLT